MSQSVDESDRAIDLSRFDSDFQREKIDDSSTLDAIPDGKYRVIVQEVLLKETQSSGNPMVRWTLRIIGSPMDDRLLWKNRVITNNTLKYLKVELHMCGLDLQSLSELPQHLEQMRNIQLEVTKRTKGPNDNIYFNRRIPDGDAGPSGDDLPF
jgi:hypothetical protein